jgi:hypothetical protein
MKTLICTLLILSVVVSLDNDLFLWPRPQNYTFGSDKFNITDPCAIKYNFLTNQSIPVYVYELIGFYTI